MTLVKMETSAVMNTIVQLNNNLTDLKYVQDFWTSGSSLNCPFTFEWCDTGTAIAVEDSSWAAGQPSFDNGQQMCVDLNLKTGSLVGLGNLEDWTCSTTKSFICEAERNKTTCDKALCPEYDCVPEPAKVNMSKNWQGGLGGIFRSGCNRQYFLSTDKKTQKEAAIECCKYGLSLLSVETYDEIKCLVDMNNWFLGSAAPYWTSLTNDGIGCARSPSWCPSGAPVTKDIPWTTGEPSDPINENCAALWYSNYDYKYTGLQDFACNVPQYYICEGDVQPECQPSCPVTTCTKDNSLFGGDGKLLNPNTYGVWKTTCGRQYMFSYAFKTYQDSWNFCCSIGMKLISVETADELKCIHDLNNADMKYVAEYMTTGVSYGCPFLFAFCGTDARVYKNDTRWEPPYEPNNNGGYQFCLMLHVGVGAAGATNFWDLACPASRFICEGPAV
ncbi:uncharacterized protein LOC132194301 [Neocloeon triangulifer]|uniref:uncharacterized protein LOC132194301 n=1 Tax=Neocloeon triangulifer TaxID=2078957 RepID=UPI00286F7E6D|nr:uncharacterized protein LOC132194301 [Neocloeon triangulifer]